MLAAVLSLTLVTTLFAVAMVPNNQSMNKLPKVEGLLSYRSDDRKLYLKEKSQWKALATQKDIKDVTGKLESFKQEINNKLTTVNKDVKVLRHELKSESEKKIKDVIGKFESFKQKINNKLNTVNKDVKVLRHELKSESERKIKDVISKFESFKQEINNKLKTVNKVLTHESCKQIWMSQSNKGSGVYQISVGKNEVIKAYCRMTSVSGCQGGGWTMVMKIYGSSSTFKYSSSYWTSKNTYYDNDYGRNGGLDNRQYKGSTYWRTSFKEICVGMKYGGHLRAFSFSYPASSLYSLIADDKYRQTRLGRSQWKWLIYGSSLQRHCNREGFNVYVNSNNHAKVRLGLVANEQNDCNSPDSFIGLGAFGDFHHCDYSQSANAAGNIAMCGADNGNKNTKAMGYIFVR